MPAGMASAIDPITLEVVRNRLDAIVQEMGEVTMRTARSPVVYNGRDFSCGIFDADAKLLAIGTSVPIHIVPIVAQVKTTLERLQDDLRPGDIFIGNDPFDGGTHLNDVLIFLPIFSGGELVAFAANRAHWYDIGGMVPGSISGSSREIYQEGLRIPPMRLGRRDELNPEVLDFIRYNVRVPEQALGDVAAQVASCRLARDRIGSLIDRYGNDTLLAHFAEILDSSERRLRARIASMPDGSVAHEGYMDNDGITADHKAIRVRVTVDGDGLHVDFSGSAEQSAGPLNVGIAMAHCFAFMGVKAALDPSGPINSGSFRPIAVTAPEGTMLNARPPAAMGGMGEVGQAAIYTMVALSKWAPNSVSAEDGAGANHQNLAGIDTRSGTQKRFIYYDYPGGGGGGRARKDGLDFVRTLRSGNVNVQSVEILENLFPITFVRHELRPDSGGPGEFRGGLGVIREYRTSSDGSFSMLGDHALIPTGGLFQGYPGATARWEVVRDDSVLPISPTFGSKVTGFPIEAGDTVRVLTQGGAGYGDPLKRDPAHIHEDVRDRKVSHEAAHDIYGVVLDPDSGEVDARQTEERRREISNRRRRLAIQKVQQSKVENGMRVAWLHPSAAAWIEEGGFAEGFVAGTPNVIRLHIGFDPATPPESISMDEEICELLGIGAGEMLVLRPIVTKGGLT